MATPAVSINGVTFDQWVNLLSQYENKKGSQDSEVHIYETNPLKQEKGGRFLNLLENKLFFSKFGFTRLIEKENEIAPRKLSFVEILHHSDQFLAIVEKTILNKDQSLTEEKRTELYGKCHEMNRVLNGMRIQVVGRHFSGFFGGIHRVISAICHLRMKYLNSSVDTGIFWPGSSDAYAQKIMQRYLFFTGKLASRN